MQSFKHIVPKRNCSMTNSSNKNTVNYSHMKVENLNVRTAENMKNPYNITLKTTTDSFCTPKPNSLLGNYYKGETPLNNTRQFHAVGNNQLPQGPGKDHEIKGHNNGVNPYNQIHKRTFDQADLQSNKIGAVYEYNESVNQSAMKRAKFY